MLGTIDFTYDQANDVVIAVPKWTISSREDCEAWFHQWEAYLLKYGRKVDCVVVLDAFHIDASIASVWGEYRAKLNNNYFRHSFRVHADPTVRLFVQTSGVRFNAASSEALAIFRSLSA